MGCERTGRKGESALSLLPSLILYSTVFLEQMLTHENGETRYFALVDTRAGVFDSLGRMVCPILLSHAESR